MNEWMNKWMNEWMNEWEATELISLPSFFMAISLLDPPPASTICESTCWHSHLNKITLHSNKCGPLNLGHFTVCDTDSPVQYTRHNVHLTLAHRLRRRRNIKTSLGRIRASYYIKQETLKKCCHRRWHSIKTTLFQCFMLLGGLLTYFLIFIK